MPSATKEAPRGLILIVDATLPTAFPTTEISLR